VQAPRPLTEPPTKPTLAAFQPKAISMIHPKRDFTLAICLTLLGIAAFIWGIPVFAATEPSPRMIAGLVGGLVAFFGFLATLNFWFALRLQHRLRSGAKTVFRWTVPPAIMQTYVHNEARRTGPRPHWQPNQTDIAKGLEIAFEPEAVLVGGRVYTMPSSGMQAIRAVSVEPGTPPVIEFQTQLFTVSGGSAISVRVHKGLLRLPAPDPAMAEHVRRYYQDIITGRTIIAPDRWTKRIRWGRWIAVISVLLGIAGYVIANSTGWRGDDATGIVAITLMLVGFFGFPAGLAIMALAAAFQRRQRGS
jgi:hypothetical protein